MPEEEVKETKKDKEKEEEKDGEKLALGLVGAGLLAAGTAVGISKLNEQGSDIRVKKNYADLSSDMNSIPIIDIDDSGNSGVIKMAEEQPIEVVSSDPVEDMVVEEPKEQTPPQPVQEPQPIKYPSGGSSGGSGGGGGYTPSGTGGGNTGGEVTPTSEVVPQEAEPTYDLVISVSEVENFISKLKTAAKGLEDNWKDIFGTELNYFSNGIIKLLYFF